MLILLFFQVFYGFENFQNKKLKKKIFLLFWDESKEDPKIDIGGCERRRL